MRTLILVFLCCFAVQAIAFEPKDIAVSNVKKILKWDTSKGPIQITLNSKGSDNLPIATVQTAVQNAMNIWQAVPLQSARFQFAGTSSSAVANSTDMKNSILWVESGWAYSSSVLAITKYSYFITDPPTYADVDVLMNGQSQKWSVNGGGAHPQQVLMHELGHLLGLSHTAVFSAALYPYLPAKVSFALSPDDKAGLQFMYGAPVADFRALSPVANAIYMEGMTAKSLPLPVFRWNRGPHSGFTLEFSDTQSFAKKVSVPAGSADSYPLKATQEQQLQKLSPASKTVYWRVAAGNTKTTPRSFKFGNPMTAFGSSSASFQTEDNTNHVVIRRFAGALTIALLLSALSILVFRRLQKART